MRRLTPKLIIAVLAIGGGFWVAQTVAPLLTEPQPARPTTAAAPSATVTNASVPSVGPSGDQLVQEVINRSLERRPNIAAKVRQIVRVDDERLSGQGTYWQQGVGNLRRTRWELETMVGADLAYVTQVYDGEYVWTDRKLPGTRKVTRVHLEGVRRALVGQEPAGQGGVLPSFSDAAARGGLSQLLASLARCYTFSAPQAMQMGEQTMLAVLGTWRPEQLEKEWAGLSTKPPDEWPAHLPHHVLLYIDSSELFPYLIEYRAGADAGLVSEPNGVFATRNPLALFEFHDVQFFGATMPASLFQYTPPDPSYTDVTGRVIEELRAAATPAAQMTQRDGTLRQ
ncbi:hypothetical protein PLANPX_4555 [Lacipirellula parvula]|uniref:Uncharacterized protein n=1 Tax=Lacipirellula parvula TaxID=2650471 RepID=A0A5K7XKS1_9BACT|nr:hypothetical protein PLANPX_4555 [Lacipirellula parvula]